jgi:hypothetical protein
MHPRTTYQVQVPVTTVHSSSHTGVLLLVLLNMSGCPKIGKDRTEARPSRQTQTNDSQTNTEESHRQSSTTNRRRATRATCTNFDNWRKKNIKHGVLVLVLYKHGSQGCILSGWILHTYCTYLGSTKYKKFNGCSSVPTGGAKNNVSPQTTFRNVEGGRKKPAPVGPDSSDLAPEGRRS